MDYGTIKAERIGKRYRIGGKRERYDSLRESLVNAAKSAGARLAGVFAGNVPGAGNESFWALKDIEFEVGSGEVVGVIGKNGAGKSTLLKILSRITEPTEGRAHLAGRIGSLLEVGTGFHPELTGRENIYLSGAILGMKKREIDAKFDEIVEFSGVDKFLETAAKRYSSGMYVRLGFAVAAHLDPEILMIDEVLAVGDVQFQKRCLGKMGDIAGSGRTILFVSHNMAAVSALCPRVIVIDGGRIVFDGATGEGIARYMETFGCAGADVKFDGATERKGEGPLRFSAFRLEDSAGVTIPSAMTAKDISLVIEYESAAPLAGRSVEVNIGVNRWLGADIFTFAGGMAGADFSRLPQNGEVRCRIPRLPLAAGAFPLNLFCKVDGAISDWILGGATLEVVDGDYFGSGKLPPSGRSPVLVDHEWEVADRPLSGVSR